MTPPLSRRAVLRGLAAAGPVAAMHGTLLAQLPAASSVEIAPALTAPSPMPALSSPPAALSEVAYTDVSISGTLQLGQRENVHSILLGLNRDSLLKPYREMAGQPAPGAGLGGWYEWKPDYDYHHDDAGLAPGHSFGQWVSAMARLAAGRQTPAEARAALHERVIDLTRQLNQTISPDFFAKTRFPGYTFDKLACGLMDAHRLAGDPTAFATLDRVTDAALPSLPGHAIDRDIQSHVGRDLSWVWDENYTVPENLYLLSAMGAGARYRTMAEAYLLNETFFEPLSRGVNALSDRHAYSYVNSLCSAMQAYLTGGSAMHLEAARNGFEHLERQSFASGGWGPGETLQKPGYNELAKSLTASHEGFETPCGGYAHLKLTRYLLRATRDGRYGDSMERVLHNALLGALPLQPDGRAFYNSDYNVVGKRVYSIHRWPCCSGTLPQVVADYGINTYLRDPGGVWVVLYQSSELHWTANGHPVSLRQMGSYPETDTVHLEVTAAHPVPFALRLRVPAWASSSASLRVNGKDVPMRLEKGFASVDRSWHNGDVVDLHLPMSLRLEELPANGGVAHPETVALLYGPWVLFAVRAAGELGPIGVPSAALLAADRTGPRSWSVSYGGERHTLAPFADLGERTYSTYFKLL